MTRKAATNAIPADLVENAALTHEQAAAYETLIQLLEEGLHQPATREELELRAMRSGTECTKPDPTAPAHESVRERPFGSGT